MANIVCLPRAHGDGAVVNFEVAIDVAIHREVLTCDGAGGGRK